ncbi:MAG: GDSL-type esterase/lipase family protein, partial [Verrucomicrobiota bacterium]
MVLMGLCRVWGDALPVRILPLGDSITLGCCSDVDIEGGYRTPLYNMLTNAGYNVDYLGTLQDYNNPALPDSNHEGHGGYRIDQIDAEVNTWLRQDGDPDVILLLIGVNDYWQNYNTTTATNRLENLIIHLANQRPYAKILVANLLLRTDNPSYETAQTPFNNAIPQIAARQTALGRQVYFVDLHSSCEPADINDGVHPKQSGYLKLAQTWFPAITNVISPWGTTNPPAIARVMQADFQHVLITFSKPLEDAATNLANFSLNGGLSVLQAQLDPGSKRTITLSTTTQAQNTFYTVSVSGVRDRTPAHTPIAPGSTGGFASLTLANGSFEADYAGWLTNGNQTVASEAQFPTSNGSKVVVFNDGETTPNGVLSQTFTTTPGQAYVLKFDLGVVSYNQNEQQLQLRMQGNSTLLLDTASLLGGGGGTVVWAAKSYSFVADSPTTTLTFHDVSPTTAGLDMLLDNVRVNPQNPRTLTVSSLPSGGLNIGVSPADNNGAQNGVTTFSRIYESGTIVNLTAPATAGTTVFAKWQLNGLDFSTSPSASVSMDTDQTLTAIYSTAPPAITNQPLSLTARVGSTALFSVMASGQTPLSYQWRHNGTNIPGANSSSYTKTNVQAADSGNFDVIVSNTGGATVSSTAVLTVITSGSLANGSFESGGAGWMESGNEVIVADSGFPTTDGVRVSVFNGGQTTPNGVLRQRFTTTPGQTYLLQLDMGVIAHNQDSQSLNVTVQG